LKVVSPKLLTRRYLAALVSVAGLSMLCHLALIRQIKFDARSSAIISLAERQRVLSQRIAAAAAEYRLHVPGARESLLRSSSAFELNSKDLLDEITAMPHEDPTRNTLLQLYLDGPPSVQAQSQLFVSEARILANNPPDDPAGVAPSTAIFSQARSPLLDKLESVATVERRQSSDSVRSLGSNQNILLALILITLGLEAMLIFRPMIHRIVVVNSTLVAVAATDPLTGLQNRRAFLESGDVELFRARRYHRPLSLLMLDVDNFKGINDTYGHGGGDRVLTTLAGIATQTLRSIDRSGRLGGEEFAFLLPETPLSNATLVAERLRVILAELEIPYDQSVIRFTVSIGVSQIASTVSNLTEALVPADRALYHAKAQGRNRVVATNQTPSAAAS
jgi:diguanylate cyclase (GGDEF)-like protein